MSEQIGLGEAIAALRAELDGARRGRSTGSPSGKRDPDALNFLGIAALRSGDRAAAVGRWTEAARLHDAVAPLLVALIEAPR